MKPLSAVQALFNCDKSGKILGIGGSCFRLWSPNHYITAAHCVDGKDPKDLKVMNCLSENQDICCVRIDRHPKSDIAVLEVRGNIPSEFQQFKITNEEWLFGDQIHCFGFVCAYGGRTNVTYRVIGGIIQRDLTYDDGIYSSQAIELSAPIPIGMSGGPAFYLRQPDTAMGVAIASMGSEVVTRRLEEYEDKNEQFKEVVKEITQYGVVLLLSSVKDWLQTVMPSYKTE